jgi:hypothetical protein
MSDNFLEGLYSVSLAIETPSSELNLAAFMYNAASQQTKHHMKPLCHNGLLFIFMGREENVYCSMVFIRENGPSSVSPKGDIILRVPIF